MPPQLLNHMFFRMYPRLIRLYNEKRQLAGKMRKSFLCRQGVGGDFADWHSRGHKNCAEKQSTQETNRSTGADRYVSDGFIKENPSSILQALRSQRAGTLIQIF